MTRIEKLVNREILNRSLIHEEGESQWAFPLDKATAHLKEVNLYKPITQKMVAGFVEIIFPVCLAWYEDSIKDN